LFEIQNGKYLSWRKLASKLWRYKSYSNSS